MLTVFPVFLARITGPGDSVSGPKAYGWGLYRSLLLIVLVCFPSVGETLCEMLLARTRSDAWLIDLDPFRLIPMMIVRVIISLKKAASQRQSYSGLEAPSMLSMNLQGGYSTHAVDGIPLSALEGERV